MSRGFSRISAAQALQRLALMAALVAGTIEPCAAQSAATPPQTRLRQGIHEAQQGHPSEAMAIFSELAKEHPELPEAFWHLAMAYRASGLTEQAHGVALVLKLNHPNYAPAYELLGDIQLDMARRSLSEYARLGGREPLTLRKRTAIDQFAPRAGTAVAARSASGPAVPVAPASSAAAPAVAAASAATAAAGTAGPAGVEVEASVREWAQAWSRRDVAAYLSAYSPNFEPAGLKSRADWEQQRRARIQDKSRIEVTLQGLRVDVKGEQATATFQQVYRTDALNLLSRKVLTLHRQGQRWLIQREQALEEARAAS